MPGGIKLGLEAKLYRNSASYASPTWVEVENVRDLTLNMQKGTADVTIRGGNGWAQKIGTLKEGSVSFDMIYDSADTDFAAIQTAFLASTASAGAIEFLVMDSDIAVTGAQGLRALMSITKFNKKEQLTEAQMTEVEITPTYSTHAPAWVTSTAGSPPTVA